MSDLPTLSGNLSALIQVQTSKPAREISRPRTAITGNENQPVKPDDKAVEAAQKFEALLIHNMLKGMRKTTMAENTSNARGLYDDMLDEKLADTMIEAGGFGVAKQIISQIQANSSSNAQVDTPDTTASAHPVHPARARTDSADKQAIAQHSDQTRLRQIALSMRASTDQQMHTGQSGPIDTMQHSGSAIGDGTGLSITDVTRLRMASELWGKEDNYERIAQQQRFLEPLVPHARRNAEKLGTSHEAILAIAALETGWGRSMIKTEQGQNSFNLFGIKATSADKEFAQTTTTEYINGRAEKIEARFRTYKNSADAIDGFANFVLENPRYSNALKHAGNPERFLQELHSAGYATDPKYADKAISVMNQIKNHPLPL